MKLLVFSVRDRVADMFGNPMFLVSAGQAVRSFSDEVNRSASDNNLYLHPDDYDLYALGAFDTSTGAFDVHLPEMVALGKNLKLNGK